MVLGQRLGAKHDVALLELFPANLDHRRDDRSGLVGGGTGVRRVDERGFQQLAHPIVIEVSDRDHHEIRRDVGLREIVAQRFLIEGADARRRAENRPPERMVVPETLGEQLVDQVVGRVLDHLDLFEDDLLLALDVFVQEQRVGDQVRQDLDRQRQMLVEHLQVIAGVFLRRKGVDLAAD